MSTSMSVSSQSSSTHTTIESLEELNKYCEQIFRGLDDEKDIKRRKLKRDRKQRLTWLKRELDALHEVVARDQKQPQALRRPDLPKPDDAYIKVLGEAIEPFGGEPTKGEFVHYDRALAHICFARGEAAPDGSERWFAMVQRIIQQISLDLIPKDLENELELLWDHASYRLEERENPGLKLNSVNMYRIRRRRRCPTLERSGLKKYRISFDARRELDQQFEHDPKPVKNKKAELAKRTGLRVEVVSNWFKNKRQRFKKGSRKGLCSQKRQEFIEPQAALGCSSGASSYSSPTPTTTMPNSAPAGAQVGQDYFVPILPFQNQPDEPMLYTPSGPDEYYPPPPAVTCEGGHSDAGNTLYCAQQAQQALNPDPTYYHQPSEPEDYSGSGSSIADYTAYSAGIDYGASNDFHLYPNYFEIVNAEAMLCSNYL